MTTVLIAMGCVGVVLVLIVVAGKLIDWLVPDDGTDWSA